MHKCLLTATIFIQLLSLELFAQHTPLDLCVRDSLFRVMPHESQVQKALIYLELSEIIQEVLPEKSFSIIVSALRISILEKNNSLKARTTMQMGNHFTLRRKFMQAHEQHFTAWRIYQGINDTTGQIEALVKIGIINRTLTNYPKSLVYLKKAMDLAYELKNKSVGGMVFDQVGLTYQAMGDRKTALYFLNRALGLLRQAGDKPAELGVQNDIGSFYLNEDRNEEGLKFFMQLLQETDSSSERLKGILYTRIGHIYSKEKDYQTSLKYNLKALEIRQHFQSSSEINSSLINIAGDYYNLEKPDSGKLYLDSGITIATRYNRINLIENGFRHLYLYYNHHGNYAKALDCYARYTSVHKAIVLEQYRNNIAILETSQQLQRIQQSGKMIARQHEVQSLNLKYQNYHSSVLEVLSGLAGLFSLMFVFLLLFLRRERRKMQNLHMRLSDEISDRELTEEHTRANENQYKFITDNSDDFITHLDYKNTRIYASPASVKIYGYTPQEILVKSPNDLTHPDFHVYSESKFATMLDTRSSQQLIYQAIKKDGTIFWVESILNPLFDPLNGEYKGMVGVTRDIQERKAKEMEIMEGTKQKENLLKEIHHRVKNNFAILVSLINMQMAQTKNPELLQSLTNLQLRIRTMALVHEMLYRSNDFEKISFPGYLRTLASVIAGTYNRRDIKLTVEADEVVMDIEASIPLGLIVNEILSNSYKHGFPEEQAGNIKITFKVDQDSGNYILVLKDDGVGMPAGVSLNQFTTMGMQVVQILCTQIEATLVVANDPGASFTITFQTADK